VPGVRDEGQEIAGSPSTWDISLSSSDCLVVKKRKEQIENRDATTEMQLPQGLPTVGGGTESFWRTNLHELDDCRSTEQLPEQSDIVIIGAGYAGVATAYHLLEAGSKASITLLEARGACSGATGRNGGHLRPDLYGHIPTHIDRQGLEDGAAIAVFEAAHITAIKNVVAKENIDCDFVITRTTDVWCNEDAAENAKASYDKMVAYGLKYMDDVDFYIGKDAEGVSICNVLRKVCLLMHHRSVVSSTQKHAQHILRVRSGHTSSS
jgi:hypothetical protein